MNSYPYPYPYQTPFSPCNNFPTWDGFGPRMKEDATNPCPMPQHWPYNYAHPAPTPCQNCSTHGPQPSCYYNFRPPYPHFPMPHPSFDHYYGGYPPYPYVPPPHFSMPEAFHCCECPNHPSHVKKSTNNNVVIEEHHPEVEAKKAVSELSAPAVLSNSSHPLLWAKPRREIEGCKLNEPQIDVEKPKKSIEQEPNVRYQWFPLDVDGIKRIMEPQEKKDWDEKKTKMADHVENKEQNKQFPFPIIWMPYGVQGEERTKGQEQKNNKTSAIEPGERNTVKHAVEEAPCTFPSLRHPNVKLVKERGESNDDVEGVGTRGGSKIGNNVKIIPVKQLDDPVPVPKKKEEEGEMSKSVKNLEAKPSSPTKKSKSLPPICLRVDPPRKKNGKGSSSRSPSPPGKKTCQESRDDKEEKNGKEERKDKEIVENNPNGNGVVENGSSFVEHQSEVEGKVCEFDENDVRESQGVEMSKPRERDGPEKRMSETEAAVVIQSVYRGYVVRRWEPLKKLRQIANVREEARKVGEQIEKLESDGNVESKKKVAVGETIMNLLLKLDTIQGLHPSVRDVRKSVATELIRLQEKLDSVVTSESVPMGRSSIFTEAGDAAGSLEATSDASKILELGQKEEEIVAPIRSSSEFEAFGSLDERKTLPEDDSIEAPVDQSTEEQHSEDTSAESGVNKDQEGNPDAESTQESVTNDVSRMEWECDLGANKNVRESVVAEASLKEIAGQILDNSGPREKCDEDVASVIESEMVAEIHAEDFKQNNVENESNGVEIMQQVENSSDDEALCVLEPIIVVDQQAVKECQITEPPEENAEGTEHDICRMDWECDTGAARLTHDIDPTQQSEPSLELEIQVDQPQVQCDHPDAADPENPILDAESRDETITDDAEHEPVTEVEKQVIEECGPEQLEERTNSDETSRRIVEENEKLREMVEKLVACGKDQQEVISSLTAKVSNLEKKIPKRRSKVKSSKRPRVVLPRKPVG